MHTESHNTAREVREPQVYGNNTKYVNLISYTKVLNVRQGKEHKCNIGAPMNCFEMKILYLYDIFSKFILLLHCNKSESPLVFDIANFL